MLKGSEVTDASKRSLHPQLVVASAALFMLAFDNITFFSHLLKTYGTSLVALLHIMATAILSLAVMFIILSLMTFGRSLKPVLVLVLLLASQTAYFMDTYNVIIDDHMIQNVFETDFAESKDLLSVKQLMYFLALGVLPSAAICSIPLRRDPWGRVVRDKLITMGIALAVLGVVLVGNGRFYASFFREHKPLRYYSNPVHPLYSIAGFLGGGQTAASRTVRPLGTDVRIPSDRGGRRLIVVVVGEATRWDHLSLNGYLRETNPRLRQKNVTSLTQVSSCGTETAISVPCMFSILGRSEYSERKGLSMENVLDVLQRAGVSILWRENNSDSKGVALRVPYEDFKQSSTDSRCEDGECRDERMLTNLDEYVEKHPKGDILIVLHTMGAHGPAYYKRYPASFEIFKPTCKTNQFDECSREAIVNAYDNALLYSDAFLAEVISFLERADASFQTAMIYMSDHGESLGEQGLYLHGFPYIIAPEAQTHVAALLWFGRTFPIDRQELLRRAGKPYSHDFLFHTLLGLVEAQTSIYKSELDLLNGIIGENRTSEQSASHHPGRSSDLGPARP